MYRESVQSGSGRAASQLKQNKDTAASDGHTSLSRWSSNAESVSLSDTLDASHDKLASRPTGRYSVIGTACNPACCVVQGL